MTKVDVIDSKPLPVSVVIATLGGEVLSKTIGLLNDGHGTPEEILVCIPEDLAEKADGVSAVGNVKIIKTTCRGQVAQRAEGLRVAGCEYIMQMDDDIVMQPDALVTLLNVAKEKKPGSVVAPFFRLHPGGEDGTRYVGGMRGFLRNCHASIVCGAPFGRNRLGRIFPSGTACGVAMSTGAERVIESEWLPGGVALCHKKDVIADDYYPFPGKAYSEDLIHSVLWQRKGCRMWTVLDVSAMIDVSAESFDWSSVMARYRSHAYVAKLNSSNILRTRLWFVFYCLANVHRLVAQNIGGGAASCNSAGQNATE